LNGERLEKNKPNKFTNFKEDYKNLKYFLIGSSVTHSHTLGITSLEGKKLKSDQNFLPKDSMCGEIKGFFLLDQDLSEENIKKICEFYKISQTLSNINYDSELEGSILLNINAFSLKKQETIDDDWITLNKTEPNVNSYVLFNEECENAGNKPKRSFINTLKILGLGNKKKNLNYNDLQEKKEIKVGDIKARSIAFVHKFHLLNAFLSIGNMDILIYNIELLSDFKYINEKKTNFVVSEAISLISAFNLSEIQSQHKPKEISEFFKKNGLDFFSLLINRVFLHIFTFLFLFFHSLFKKKVAIQ